MVSMPSAWAALRFLRVIGTQIASTRQHRGIEGDPTTTTRGDSHAEVVEEDRLGWFDPVTLAGEEVYSRLRLPVTIGRGKIKIKKERRKRKIEKSARARKA